jgi:hypothetical protein
MVGMPVPGLPAPGQPLTQEIVRSVFHYDPETGALIRRLSYGGCVGRPIEAISRGRRRLALAGRNYFATRIIWLYVYGYLPDCDIDHVDRNPLNDKLSNLRLASRAQNSANKVKYRTNTSGYKGVRHRSDGRWVAEIGINGKRRHLGSFKSSAAAHAAYAAAARALQGDFACVA